MKTHAEKTDRRADAYIVIRINVCDHGLLLLRASSTACVWRNLCDCNFCYHSGKTDCRMRGNEKMESEITPSGEIFDEEEKCRLVEAVINALAEQKVSVEKALITLEEAKIQIKKSSVVSSVKAEAGDWGMWKLESETR